MYRSTWIISISTCFTLMGKKKLSSKKKPGRAPWHKDDPEKLEWLRGYISDWKESQKGKDEAKSKFYNALTLEFIEKFNDPLHDDDDPENCDDKNRGNANGSTTGAAIPAVGNASGHNHTLLPDPNVNQATVTSPSQPTTSSDNSQGLNPGPDDAQITPTPSQNVPADNPSVPDVPADKTTGTDQQPSLDDPAVPSAEKPSGRDSASQGSTGTPQGITSREFTWRINEKLNGLSDEAFERKHKIIMKRRKQISEWYRENNRSVQRGTGGLIEKVFAKPKPTRKPTKMPAPQMFQDLYYDSYVKKEAEKEIELEEKEYDDWEKAGSVGDKKKPAPVAIRLRVATRILQSQPQEFQDEINKAVEGLYNKELEEWNEKPEVVEPKTKTPEDFQKALQSWGPEVAKFGKAVSEDTGMVLDTSWNNVDWTTMAYEATKQSLIRFGRKVYNHESRAARAVGNIPVVPVPSFNDVEPIPASSTATPEPTSSTQLKRSSWKSMGNSTEKNKDASTIEKNPKISRPRPQPPPLPEEPSSLGDTRDSDPKPAQTVSSGSQPPSPSPASANAQFPAPSMSALPEEVEGTGSVAMEGIRADGDIQADVHMDDPEPKAATEWGNKFDCCDRAEYPWKDTLDSLLEVYIEYEGYFHYTEVNGAIESKKEPSLLKRWVRKGQPPFALFNEELSVTAPKMLDVFRGWWEDVQPVRESDQEDWAPFDCVSGSGGVWKFICVLIWLLHYFLGESPGEDLTDQQMTYIASWMVLCTEVEETLAKVMRWGITAPRKRKSATSPEETDQPRTTRRMVALQRVNDAAKPKSTKRRCRR
ncbi:hypothetical protein D9758_017828 [Tetrapyrgos nigripes]|uniref:Uncharacterized protein n=1 Tax=Tetrapyrgos nigripes TaxID=182062 RepID=A0A8H5C7I6_9AGAR|nr:hypothetical protein D9758_017828 [Tetrapyrgos nigripes]